jgi:hypothetical protein
VSFHLGGRPSICHPEWWLNGVDCCILARQYTVSPLRLWLVWSVGKTLTRCAVNLSLANPASICWPLQVASVVGTWMANQSSASGASVGLTEVTSFSLRG